MSKRAGKGRGAGTGAKQAAAVGGCGAADARMLPAREAAVVAVSGGRHRRSDDCVGHILTLSRRKAMFSHS